MFSGVGLFRTCLSFETRVLQEYWPRLLKLEEKRLDLVHAETLFDLPLTDYSSFIKCKTDMEGLEQIYKLHKQQKVSIAS